MPQTIKRVLGDFSLQTVGADGTTTAGNISLDSGNVTVTGNLTVTGTTTTINTQNSLIADKVITLNQGESGPGVGGDGKSGFEIERGSSNNVSLRWNESATPSPRWELTNDGSTYGQIATIGGLGGLLAQVEDDTNPVLGGNLNANGYVITSSSNQDVTVDPAGTGDFKVESPVKLKDSANPAAAVSGYTILYANSSGSGSQIFYKNTVSSGEIASSLRARRFGLIF